MRITMRPTVARSLYRPWNPATMRPTVTRSLYRPWNPATMRPTMTPTVTRSPYRPWNPATLSTKLLTRYPIKNTGNPTQIPITASTTLHQTTTTTVQKKTLRIQPGTILLMESEYLKEKYMTPGLATTYHRALLADYFGLSEREMKDMGMTVVAWGFSYQVKDKATKSRGRNRAPKYFCDFKFRSATFNAGYVGAHINMDMSAEFNG